jgi:methionyl-tRNA formyltransferase
VVDVSAYRIYYRLLERNVNDRLIRRGIEDTLGVRSIKKPAVPYCAFRSLNGPEALAALRALQPDVIFSACVNEFFGSDLRAIAPLGLFVYHEGVTPGYRGLHTGFWARQNNELDKVGYTLLQATAEMDAGPVLVQGLGEITPDLEPYWCWAAHKALLDGLPAVESALEALANGHAKTTEPCGESYRYSYAGLSDQVRRWLGHGSHLNHALRKLPVRSPRRQP